MKVKWLIVIISVLAVCSCKSNKAAKTAKKHRSHMLDSINRNNPYIYRDSLLSKINSADRILPEDLTETILVQEVLTYEEFLLIQSNKFFNAEDDEGNREIYSLYKDFLTGRQGLAENYRHNLITMNRSAYDTLDTSEYRYVLKYFLNINSKDNTVIFHPSGEITGWWQEVIYYIYDRKKGKYYKGFKDLSVLTEL